MARRRSIITSVTREESTVETPPVIESNEESTPKPTLEVVEPSTEPEEVSESVSESNDVQVEKIDSVQITTVETLKTITNETGYEGVRFEGGLYIVELTINESPTYFGSYENLLDAVSVRDKIISRYK